MQWGEERREKELTARYLSVQDVNILCPWAETWLGYWQRYPQGEFDGVTRVQTRCSPQFIVVKKEKKNQNKQKVLMKLSKWRTKRCTTCTSVKKRWMTWNHCRAAAGSAQWFGSMWKAARPIFLYSFVVANCWTGGQQQSGFLAVGLKQFKSTRPLLPLLHRTASWCSGSPSFWKTPFI